MKIFMKLYQYYIRKKRLVDYFYCYQDYLENGKYKFDKSLTYIYKSDSQHQNSKYDFNTEVSGIILLLVTLSIRFFVFKGKLKINSSNKKFEGELFLPANNKNSNSDAKIFDYKRRRVLSVFADVNCKFSEVENYNLYSKFFNMPKMLKHEYDCIEYELVEHLKKKYINTSIILKAFEEYIQSFIEFVYYSNKNNLYDIKEMKLVLNENLNVDKKSITVFYPKVKVHNDMWTSNVLINKYQLGCMYIDWEHAGLNFALFDFFWWAQNEYIYNNNPQLLKKLFSGEFDAYFKIIFDTFNIDYENDLLAYYYLIFVLSAIECKYHNTPSSLAKELFINQCRLVVMNFDLKCSEFLECFAN